MKWIVCVLLPWVMASCGGESRNGAANPQDPVDLRGQTAGEEPRETNASIQYALDMLSVGSESRDEVELPKEIKDREAAYTTHWLNRALKRDLRRQIESKRMRFLQDVGPNGDDAIAISLDMGLDRCQVVDGRLLVVAIRGAKTSEARTSDVFSRVLNYGYNLGKDRASFELVAHQPVGQTAGWGKISVSRGKTAGWFKSPILWYESEGQVVLILEKVLAPPAAKGPTPMHLAPDYVGGLPAADARPYRRFTKSNREALAIEQFAAIRPKGLELPPGMKTGGQVFGQD